MDTLNSNAYELTQHSLLTSPAKWLITGVAGFIGSNLLEALLRLDQKVVGLDNFSAGHQANLDEVRSLLSATSQWKNFSFHEGDIRDPETCRKVCSGVDYVLHQAAMGSVPRSIAEPMASHESNLTGFLNMLIAARDTGVKRFVYASSSSIYGDHPDLPKVEDNTGHPLSPYAVTKAANELYAGVFARTYPIACIGLRYFNVFGPRQDPDGAYAAVIPKWFLGLIKGETIFINGDGETSRDFCYIDNCVQANILAACTTNPDALNKVYNVACGKATSLNQLFEMIRARVDAAHPMRNPVKPTYRDFRPGDVRHSLADIRRAGTLLGYSPRVSVEEGLLKSAEWYLTHLA